MTVGDKIMSPYTAGLTLELEALGIRVAPSKRPNGNTGYRVPSITKLDQIFLLGGNTRRTKKSYSYRVPSLKNKNSINLSTPWEHRRATTTLVADTMYRGPTNNVGRYVKLQTSK